MLFTMLSAVMYVLPFFYPEFSIFIFFFLVPIIYESYCQKLTIIHGLFWGIIVFTLHTSWLSNLLLFESKHSFRITLAFLTVSWFSIVPLIWFWFIKKVSSFKKNNIFIFIFSWVAATMVCFLYIIKASLFVCGRIEGYVFFNPFIPLAYYSYTLWPLSYLGLALSLMLLILFQLFMVLGIMYKRIYAMYAVLLLVGLFIGCTYHQKKEVAVNNALFLKPWWHKEKDSVIAKYRMIHDVSRALYCDDSIKAVIMPESSFPWNIDDCLPFLIEICCNALDRSIVLGGQRIVKGTNRNSCFMISDGKLIFIYDKGHLMPLVERSSCLFAALGVQNFFSQNNEFFSYPEQKQEDIITINDQSYQIFLCSELYFESKSTKGIPVLFLGNDDWFYYDYAKRLSVLFIKYFEWCHKVPVLYGTTGGSNNINKRSNNINKS